MDLSKVKFNSKIYGKAGDYSIYVDNVKTQVPDISVQKYLLQKQVEIETTENNKEYLSSIYPLSRLTKIRNEFVAFFGVLQEVVKPYKDDVKNVPDSELIRIRKDVELIITENPLLPKVRITQAKYKGKLFPFAYGENNGYGDHLIDGDLKQSIENIKQYKA